MVDIFIPNKTMKGQAVNSPGSPAHGRILLKNPSGLIVPIGPGLPDWNDWEFSGTPQTTITSFEAIQAPTQNVFYVDSNPAIGNDNNIGTNANAPFRTIAKALTVHSGGDHIYLKRGGVWREQLHPLSGSPYLKSGPSESAMTVVSFYGDSGPRPVIEYSGEVITTYNRGGLRNLALDGIHFYGYRQDPNHPEFSGGNAVGSDLRFYGGNAFNVLLQDLLIDYSEITIQRATKDNAFPGSPTNFRLINLIFTGNYANHTSYTDSGKPSSIFIEPMTDLTARGLVMDYGGWHPTVQDAGANQFCHNVYLVASSDPSVGNSYLWEDNIICRGASHGIHGRPGGTYRDNFFGRNAVGLQIGYSKTPLGAGTSPLVEDNVISECYSMWRGNDVTPVAAGRSLRTGAKWGLNCENYTAVANAMIIRNNIIQIGYVQGDDRPPSTNTVGFNLQAGAIGTNQNNIVWQFPNQTGSYPDPGRTLAAYDIHLNGVGSFDSFMNRVKGRPLRGYDYRYTGKAINAFISAGYQP